MTRRIWAVALTLAIVAILGTFAGGSWLVATRRWLPQAAGIADTEPTSVQPRIPGAVATPPDWLLAIDAPFDLEDYFRPVPESMNAAPLYLDALADVSVETLECLPRDEALRRSPTVRGQSRRFDALRGAFRNDPRAVPKSEFDALHQALAPVMAKLVAAAQRPACVFEMGLDYQARLPHAPAIRRTAELFAIDAYARLREGDVDGAIAHVPEMFRLSRDLRRRGGTICQMISFATERALCDHIQTVLSAPGVSPRHCDRLLETLQYHEAGRIDPVLEALKTEYILVRVTLHDLPLWTGSFAPDKLAKLGLEHPTFESVLQKTLSSGRRGTSESDPPLRFLTVRDFVREETVTDEIFAELLAPDKTDEERKATAIAQQARIENLRITKLFFPDLPRFIERAIWHRTLLAATRGQIALRRWQVTKGGNPPTLEAAARAAGLESTPIDYLALRPLRLVERDGAPLIYSVGPDRTDDDARSEWQFGEMSDTGDWLFRIPAWRK